MATSHAQVPGEPTPTSMAFPETATAAVQNFSPIKSIHQQLCAFHFYSHDMTRQVEAHHTRQCLIYDSEATDAKLIGLEYVISEALFLTLPDSEKPLWHSHEYEVKSGVLFMPGVPGPIERQDMYKLCKTYGKTIHFWQVDRGYDLPLGILQIMLALTRDGQSRPELARDVERRYWVSFEEDTEEKRSSATVDAVVNRNFSR